MSTPQNGQTHANKSEYVWPFCRVGASWKLLPKFNPIYKVNNKSLVVPRVFPRRHLVSVKHLRWTVFSKLVKSVSLIHLSWTFSKIQDVNWTYIRRSGDVQDVFWMFNVRSIYVLCLRGYSLLRCLIFFEILHLLATTNSHRGKVYKHTYNLFQKKEYPNIKRRQ